MSRTFVIFLFLPLALVAAILLVAFEASAVDQVKSTEILVTSSDTAVSSAVNPQFTLYIGDNLAGVSDPLKSIYFTISGLYTGGSTITLSIDSDSATQKVFTLPAVSSPTAFEILYKDPSNKINPLSSGSYTYTLNIIPSGTTIYGLSATASETHRYAPASCPDGQSVNEKVKTNEFLIASSDVAVSAATTTSFVLYIGDDLAGVTNPVKSLHFVIHGIYTGGGSVSMSLDGNPATNKSFTLPSVSLPTHFEFVYKDPVNTINPSSAGSYTHTITTNPSSVTLYSLGIKLVETHRYKPPACGGMPVKGELYSAVFDTTGTTTGPTYNAMLWKGVLGGTGANEGRVRFQLAASDCVNGATNYPTCTTGSWSFIGGATCASSDWFDPGAANTPHDLQSSSCINAWNNKRYFRYAIQICSGDCIVAGGNTPVVNDVVVNYSP